MEYELNMYCMLHVLSVWIFHTIFMYKVFLIMPRGTVPKLGIAAERGSNTCGRRVCVSECIYVIVCLYP